MTKFYKKTLIIAPHADDEIFTFPFIYSKDNKFDSIDFLLLESDLKRTKEAKRSAKLNSMNLIIPEGYNFKSLYFHEKIDCLVHYFSKIWNKYDLILAPLMEGGHQDHDTTCAALFLSKETTITNSKIVLYSTYRNFDSLPYIYTCGVSKKYFYLEIFSNKFSNNILFSYIKTIFLCYRSQIKTWILLFPALLKVYFSSNLNKFVYGDNFTFKDLITRIPKKPLYQIYRGLDKKDWKQSINYVAE